MSAGTYNQKTVGTIAVITLVVILTFIIIAIFAGGCGSGVGSSSTPPEGNSCAAAGIDPGEEQTIMDAAIRDSYYFSYGDERQATIDACWNGSVSAYQADNCVACVVPLIDAVYFSP